MRTKRSLARLQTGGYVLFSFGGRAVKRRAANTGVDLKKYESGETNTYRIIDYATLESWYDENNAIKEMLNGVNGGSQVREYAQYYRDEKQDHPADEGIAPQEGPVNAMSTAQGVAREYVKKQRDLKFLLL
jgi:hypothetical protein